MSIQDKILSTIEFAKNLRNEYAPSSVPYHFQHVFTNFIAEHRIIIHPRPIRASSFCGVLVEDDLGVSIMFNSNMRKKRTYFTLGHEVGHFSLHRGDDNLSFVDVNRNFSGYHSVIETEANAFAAEWLAPFDIMFPIVKSRSIKYASNHLEASIECIKWKLVTHFELDGMTKNDALKKVEEYA